MDGSISSGHELVIVAIPSEDDPVLNYSSEKVPHLTLLYLGENKFDSSELEHVANYVEHAASLLPRFSLSVERRGTLGDKNADVLFFDKRWSEDISVFRRNLLADPLIYEAYLSAEQFPEWTPHLTMGYPETPAKKDTRDYPGFGHVSFDRIAIFTGDYTGPVFQLTYSNYGPEIAMSQIDRGRSAVDNVIEHYGVKGMRWGVHRSQINSPGNVPASEDVLKVDKHRSTVKNGGTRALSNKDLKELIDRMNLEQQYSDLKSKHKSEIDKGHNEVKRILSFGDTISKAYNLYDSPAGKVIRKAIIGV